jgi:SAM-dependent methyltransferase
VEASYSRTSLDTLWDEHLASAPEPIEERGALANLLRLAFPSRGRIIDVGSGHGTVVAWLKAHRHDAVGVDIVGPAIRMDGRAIEFPSGWFDGYVSLGVWEHDERGPYAFASEAARIVRPGGRAVVSVPYLNLRRVFAWNHEKAGVFYQYAFGRREFCQILEAAGFRVLKVTYLGTSHPTVKAMSPSTRQRWRWIKRVPWFNVLAGRMLVVVAERIGPSMVHGRLHDARMVEDHR